MRSQRLGKVFVLGLLSAVLTGYLSVAAQPTSPQASQQGPPQAAAQAGEGAKKDLPDPKKQEEIEQGIPIQSDAVKRACGACHKSDEKGRMTRISYRRTTPEGWQQTIKRMVRLNGVNMSPDTAREVLRYLSNHLGLAPEEAQPAAFESERRMIDYTYPGDRDTETTCNKCHSFGRVLTHRATKSEWELLIAMHRGYYPLVDFQAFRRGGPPQTQPGPDGRPPDNRHPMDKAIAHLSTAFPLVTPQWSAWAANRRLPKLAGRWALSAYEPGKGRVFGEVVIKPGSADDEFVTEASYVYARTGQRVARQGKTIVYAGFQWRGRNMEGGREDSSVREVMILDRAWREAKGRFFWGAYDEFGMDATLTRLGADPVLLGAVHPGLRRGDTAEIALFGANLPPGLSAPALDLGPGVKVNRVIQSSATELRAEVVVDSGAVLGVRDVFAGGAQASKAFVVYDKVDQVKVRPAAGMARVGGIVFPKQFQQFEALGYSNGADGKPDTPDDLEIGAVDVTWSLEEYTATLNDDDVNFVGTLDPKSGAFTPNVDGPNPKRRGSTNNYGDVWVVATYHPPPGSSSTTSGGANGDAKTPPKPIRARAHLLVTIPLYIKFDQPEVSQ